MLADFSRALRLVWIDHKANTPDGICRRDLLRTFGCSAAMATHDMRIYGAQNQRQFRYNLSARRYYAKAPIYTPEQHQTAIAAVELAHHVNRKDATK